MMRHHLLMLVPLLSISLGTEAAAQYTVKNFPGNGQTQTYSFKGEPEETVIPVENPPGSIRLFAKGGNGGEGETEKCQIGAAARGGYGAELEATFLVGTQPGELRPGGRLRFIVGDKGVNGKDLDDESGVGVVLEREASGGGGGGTGVLYQAPGSSEWEPLIVAGGGGGGQQKQNFGFCGSGSWGKSACLAEYGYYGHPGAGGKFYSGGSSGLGGESHLAGGGGGYYQDATGTYAEAGRAGKDTGAPGGVGESESVGSGGFGCGSGGAAWYGSAGGGGGWSGGGAGGKTSDDTNAGAGGGGGGGSYIDPRALPNTVRDVASLGDLERGYATLKPSAPLAGDTCSSAIELLAPAVQEFQTVFSGSTQGLPTVPVGCLGSVVASDRWYTFTNTSGSEVFLGFEAAVPVDLIVEQYEICGDLPVGCGNASSFGGAFFIIAPGATHTYRFYTDDLIFGAAIPFDCTMTVEGFGPDSDGDGIVNGLDNCPGTFNPDQLDDDFDGVGDVCDPCVGSGADSDFDGIDDGCDICNGHDDNADADGDGVPDACDVCFGDDNLDSDGDGTPDACDPCDGGDEESVDCDHDGIQDLCGVDVVARFSRFDPATLDPAYVLIEGQVNTEALDGRLELVNDFGDGEGSAVFEPVSPLESDSWSISFWMYATGDPIAFRGLTFSLMDAAVWGIDTQLGSEGVDGDGIGIRLYHTPQTNGTEIVLNSFGDVQTFNAPFFVNDGVWRQVEIDVIAGVASMTVTTSGGAPTQVFQDLALPGFQPFQARYGFGSGTLALPIDELVLIDDVYMQDLSGDFDRDLDDNGTPDSCESFASQELRLGTPANPEALTFGDPVGPMMGKVYAPAIDHSGFMPAAQVDYLFLSLDSGNLPLGSFGTVLTGLEPFATLIQPANQSFQVPIPVSTTLLSAPIVLQGASIDFAGGDGTELQIELTNAIDAVVGAWGPNAVL